VGSLTAKEHAQWYRKELTEHDIVPLSMLFVCKGLGSINIVLEKFSDETYLSFLHSSNPPSKIASALHFSSVAQDITTE